MTELILGQTGVVSGVFLPPFLWSSLELLILPSFMAEKTPFPALVEEKRERTYIMKVNLCLIRCWYIFKSSQFHTCLIKFTLHQ